MGAIESSWWALARSEEVTGAKPVSVDIGDQPVVLWRDSSGRARALEDRCPHRRAPLSLGCIRENGWIQCGYHGWSYDGADGRLREIPNMKGDQRFPPVYRAHAFAVSESGGFVNVCLDSLAKSPPSPEAAMPLAGTAHVALAHASFVATLFDDPGLLIKIRGVRFTPYLMSELHEEDGRFVVERNCQWSGFRWPATFSADFPITLLMRTDPITGESELQLRDADLATLLTVRLAPVPAPRGVTAIRWRANVGAVRKGVRASMLGWGSPFAMRERIDAAALRQVKPSVSLHGETLRDRMMCSPSLDQAA